MEDPLQDIENKQAQKDMGKMFARIFEGAHEETGSLFKAYMVTVAYAHGLSKGAQPEDDNAS